MWGGANADPYAGNDFFGVRERQVDDTQRSRERYISAAVDNEDLDSKREDEHQSQAQRFQIVPDYGQTAHSEQGASEPAAIVDCLPVDHICKQTDSISSYIGLTRIKKKEALLISEPFSPALFRQGGAEGPEMLMEVLKRKIDTDDAYEEPCLPLLSFSLCLYLIGVV